MAAIITRSDERSVVALRALQDNIGVSLKLAADEKQSANGVAKGAVVEVLATEQELADVLGHHNQFGHMWDVAGSTPAPAAEPAAPPAPPATIKPENAGKSA